MARLLVMVLVVQLLCAGVARSTDLHLTSAQTASDGADRHCNDGSDHDAPGKKHIGECCFGGLMLGSPPAVHVQTGASAAIPLPEFFDTSCVSWHSPVPQRPPAL